MAIASADGRRLRSSMKNTAETRLRALLGASSGPRIGLSYALRTAASAALAMVTFRFLGSQGGIWAVVSAMVVIQPETRTSVSTALLRAVANVVGVGVGISIGWFLGPWPLPALVAGVFAVALLCRVIRIDAAARSACVAMAIVLLKDPSGILGSWQMRVLGVLIGCGIALLVTVVAAQVERLIARSDARATEAPEPPSR
jgi:uncharacterized membrane protein YgaE (UPF0421/DUF939 family)